jgi:hypothetical protein
MSIVRRGHAGTPRHLRDVVVTSVRTRRHMMPPDGSAARRGRLDGQRRGVRRCGQGDSRRGRWNRCQGAHLCHLGERDHRAARPVITGHRDRCGMIRSWRVGVDWLGHQMASMRRMIHRLGRRCRGPVMCIDRMYLRRHVARHGRPQRRHEERDHGEQGAERREATTCHDDPGGARTHDLRLKRPLLYRLSYRVASCQIPARCHESITGTPCTCTRPSGTTSFP